MNEALCQQSVSCTVLASQLPYHAGTSRDSSVYVPPATSMQPLAGVTQAENCLRDSSCFMAP